MDSSALVARAWPAVGLAAGRGVWLIAVGKAAHSMAAQAATLLGPTLRGGLVIGMTSDKVDPRLETLIGAHPIPSAASEEAGRRALALTSGLTPDDQLLVLLSGGASALMIQAASGVTLEDKQRTTALLLRNGADIRSLNVVRKHLSRVKGGGLAAATRAATRTLAISDVVGDDLSVIASGPTVGDPSTFGEALDVLDRHGGRDGFGPRVVDRFVRGAGGALPETPKPGDPRLDRSRAFVAGSRREAMTGAAEEASRRGYDVITLEDPVVGEARAAASAYFARIRALSAGADRPLCVISSGETTVHVRGSGLGGRNQEFVLSLAEELAAVGVSSACASIGTDGIDGPTPSAGAIADSSTMARARLAGLAPIGHILDQNDAYRFFEALGDLVQTGPTGTNVGDLQVMLIQ